MVNHGRLSNTDKTNLRWKSGCACRICGTYAYVDNHSKEDVIRGLRNFKKNHKCESSHLQVKIVISDLVHVENIHKHDFKDKVKEIADTLENQFKKKAEGEGS